MPEIYVYALAGRTAAQKKALCEDVTAAVSKHFAVAPDAVTIQIVESAADFEIQGRQNVLGEVANNLNRHGPACPGHP